jgi:hypothetical protein
MSPRRNMDLHPREPNARSFEPEAEGLLRLLLGLGHAPEEIAIILTMALVETCDVDFAHEMIGRLYEGTSCDADEHNESERGPSIWARLRHPAV